MTVRHTRPQAWQVHLQNIETQYKKIDEIIVRECLRTKYIKGWRREYNHFHNKNVTKNQTMNKIADI